MNSAGFDKAVAELMSQLHYVAQEVRNAKYVDKEKCVDKEQNQRNMPVRVASKNVGYTVQNCPYCGHDHSHIYCDGYSYGPDGPSRFQLKCYCCGLQTPSKGTPGRALDVWNEIALRAAKIKE